MPKLFVATLIFFVSHFAFALCVNVDKAELHKGPSKQFKAVWTVGKFMPFKKLKRQGAWYQVQDLDNETYWIQSSAVTEGFNCVVVKSKTAVLRQAPNSNANAAEYALVDRYTPFKKLEYQDEYLHVANEYDNFWIKESAIWYPVNKMKLSF